MRPPRRLILVLDDEGPGSVPLVEAALAGLGERDRVAIVDSAGDARVVVPAVPGGHKTLLIGASERIVARRAGRKSGKRRLDRALVLAGQLGAGHGRYDAVVLTDGLGVASERGAVATERRRLEAKGGRVIGVATTDRVDAALLAALGERVKTGAAGARASFVFESLEPAGESVVRDLVVSFSGAPAPVRVVETSSGAASLDLEADRWFLGDLSVGEARTEVVRLGSPAWVPGEPFRLTVVSVHTDKLGRRHRARRHLELVFSDDVERIARRRHGDVIAYASALAMVRRLERAFLGSDVDRLGGLAPWVERQARSMSVLAKRRGDPALARQAEVLKALLGVIEG